MKIGVVIYSNPKGHSCFLPRPSGTTCAVEGLHNSGSYWCLSGQKSGNNNMTVMNKRIVNGKPTLK